MLGNKQVLGIFVLFVCLNAFSGAQRIELPTVLPAVCYEDGLALIQNANTDRSSYDITIIQGVTEKTSAFAGVASAVMILNSLPVTAPPDTSRPLSNDSFYSYFTQDNYFSEEVEDIVSEEEVSDKGITLKQLGNTLKAWEYGYYEDDGPDNKQFEVEDVVHASDTDLDSFRVQVSNHMADQKARIIVNFLRSDLAQGDDTGATFSPIVAFNEEEDVALIYDVARYKFDCPAYWAPMDLLFSAMQQKDKESGKSRGYIVIHNPGADHDSATGDGAKEVAWYIYAVIVLGGMSIFTFATCAAIMIGFSFYRVVRNRKKSRRSVQVNDNI